jgi:small subunit ribosomal protein S4
MSRYIGPKLRITLRLGILPGFTKKIIKRPYPPGQHGPSKVLNKRLTSAYVIRLKEKQKLRFNYGVSEKQLYGYVKKARGLKGATGTLLLQLLEMRLDNIIYRFNLAPTIPGARQLVIHGHILLNGKNVNIPSFQCQPKDIITVRVNSKTLISANLKKRSYRSLPLHLNLDKKNLIGKINSNISKENIALKINDLLIVEFYSRK